MKLCKTFQCNNKRDHNCNEGNNWTNGIMIPSLGINCIFSNLISTHDFFSISICTIHSSILKFQPFPTSFAISHAFNDLFWAKLPYNWKALQLNSEKADLAWYHHLTHITCVQKLRWLWQKMDALRVQTGPSLSKYEGFRRKLICFKGISFS